MTKSRDAPYLWVTWITDLLAGEAKCQWAAWFRAHFQQYDKQPSTFDQATWKAQHGEMVRTRAAELRSAGYTVFVEDQNKFSLRRQACTLGGKPDLVAVNADDALVVECKTGQRTGADYFQVLVYMLVPIQLDGAELVQRAVGAARPSIAPREVPADAAAPNEMCRIV